MRQTRKSLEKGSARNRRARHRSGNLSNITPKQKPIAKTKPNHASNCKSPVQQQSKKRRNGFKSCQIVIVPNDKRNTINLENKLSTVARQEKSGKKIPSKGITSRFNLFCY